MLLMMSASRRHIRFLLSRIVPARLTWFGLGSALVNSTTRSVQRDTSAHCAVWVVAARVRYVSELKGRNLISWCVNSRSLGKTVCVSALVMDACFLCLLICLEPKRYCALPNKLCFYEPQTHWIGFSFSWLLFRFTVWKTPECPNRLFSR